MGVLALAVHSAHGAAPAPDDLGAVSTTAATVSTAGQGRALPATGQATATGVRAALEQAARARTPSGIAAGPTPGGDQSEPVDESRPHSHVVDPSTGGLVSVTGAHGVVSPPDELGPVPLARVPPGTSLPAPTDTATLLERAEVEPSALADAEPITAGATAPVGTPGVSSLSQHVLPSCSGTGTDGNRVQVLYVHEADTASRFSAVLPALRSAVAGVDDVFAVSSQQTGGGRRVRWVHDASCFPVIRSVSVPDGALGSDFWGTVTALKNLGYSDPHRKYLLFADANKLCGIGTLYADTSVKGNYNDGYAASYSRVDTNCWSTSHSVAAHELTHNLGGVQAPAPHSTPNGHCYDDADLMCYVDGPGVVMKQVCASAQEQLLDCNHDDYFNTDPAPGSFLAGSWNTARSSFLDVVPVLGSAPSVAVHASTATAQTGDTVTLTASAPAAADPSAVTWRWGSNAACRLTTSGPTATLVCPATAAGAVT